MNFPNYDEGVQISQAVIRILDYWGLSAQQQIRVLDLPENTPLRTIRKYRENKPFPEEVSIYERIEHIAGINEALATTFPRNAHMAPLWMKKPHRQLSDRAPIVVMLNDGLSGLVNVRMLLDCSFAWERS